MIKLLLQASEVAEGVGKVLDNKSESFTLVIVGMALIGFVIWRWEARADKEDKRQVARESHQITKDEKDSTALLIISESTVKTADATKLMANAVSIIEQRQLTDRRAIVHVITAIQEQPHNAERSKLSLDQAKQDLLDG